jgi:hypothetical protein
VLRTLYSVVIFTSLLLTGCGDKGPASADYHHIRHLAQLYGRYQGAHKGQTPKDAEVFKKYISTLSAAELKDMGVTPDNPAALFTSPRDKEEYVICYGSKSTMPPVGGGGSNVIIYEKVGLKGKRLVALSTTAIEEVDEAKFRSLVPDAK